MCWHNLCIYQLHSHLGLFRWSEIPREGKEVTIFILSVPNGKVRVSRAVIYGKADDI